MKYEKRIVLFTLFAMNLVDQPTPEVKLEQGMLTGKISTDGTFFEYTGIPYATTNSSRRFKAPLPPPRWNGVFKATDEMYQCPQHTTLVTIGTEDCLKINVYVPVTANKPLPVIIYIHGGAFTLGSGAKMVYAPDFLMEHEVILVTFNYRQGALGFLCLGIEEAPGNAGLKDQVAALRWVQKNIAAFSGDPDNVTIYGVSAGGASAALLIASDMANGLFKRAIIHSGSSIPHWVVNRNPISVASKVAKLLGHNTEDPKAIFKLFSGVSYKDIVSATKGIPLSRQFSEGVLHSPCVEKTFPGVEPFMTDLPYNLLNRKPKNISVMYGSMSREGLLFVAPETDKTLDDFNKRSLLGDDLVFESKEEEMEVQKELKQFYFNNEDVSKKTIMNLSDYYTDLFFEMPMLLEAELRIRNNDAPIYMCHFAYSGGRNMVKILSGFKNEPGACHGDEVLYVFKGKIWPFRIDEPDFKIINYMTKLYTNFAKYGDPTPQSQNDLPVRWLPSNKQELKLLYIDDELKMGPIPDLDAFQFWKNIYTKYRRLK